MVIRSLVSDMLESLPLSDRLIPKSLIKGLKTDGGVEPIHSNVSRSKLGYDNDSKPITNTSNKIFNRMIEKRRNRSIDYGSPNADSSSFLQPISRLDNGCEIPQHNIIYGSEEIVNGFNTQGSRIPELQEIIEDNDAESEDNNDCVSYEDNNNINNDFDGGSENYDDDKGENTLVSVSTPPLYMKNVTFDKEATTSENIEKYLDDQNAKFDELINRNLDNVLHESPRSLTTSVLDVLTSLDLNINHKVEVLQNLSSIASKKFGFTKFPFNKKVDEASEQSHICVESLKEMNKYTSPNFENVLMELQHKEGENTCLDDWIHELTYADKYRLYETLKGDLEIYEDAKDVFSTPSSPKSTGSTNSRKQNLESQELDDLNDSKDSSSTIDKVQSLLIICIKLAFIFIKLLVPMSIYLYTKFRSNEMYIFNENNLNKFLTLVIKVFAKLEKNMNTKKGKTDSPNKCFSSKTSTNTANERQSSVNQITYFEHEDTSNTVVFNDIYNEMAKSASDYLKTEFTSSPNNWQNAAFSFVLNKLLDDSSQQKDKKFDPKYAQYFSKPKSRSSSDSSSTQHMSPPMSRCKSSADDLNILHVAEKFADQL